MTVQECLFQSKTYLYRIDDFNTFTKAVIITAIALAGIGFLVTSLCGCFHLIQGLNATTQWSLFGLGMSLNLALVFGGVLYKLKKGKKLETEVKNPFETGKKVSTTLKDIRKYNAYSQALSAERKKAIDEKKATQWLNRFLQEPKQYLVFLKENQGEGKVYLPPSLGESFCIESNFFNRFTTTRKQNLEQKMLNDIQSLYPPQDTKELCYLSMDFEEGLQDFIIIGKLILSGYQNIKVFLIDPKYRKQNSQDIKNEFSLLEAVAKEQSIELSIFWIESVEKLEDKCHLIQAINFDDLFVDEGIKDFLKAQSLLEDNGRLYLAVTDYDFIIGSKLCVETQTHKKTILESKMVEIIRPTFTEETRVQMRSSLNVMDFSNDGLNMDYLTCYLKAIQEAGNVSSIQLFAVMPEEIKTEYMEAFIRLLLPGLQVKIVSFDSLEELKRCRKKQDIISYFEAGKTKEIETNIRFLREKHPSASLICQNRAYEDQETLDWEAFWVWSHQTGFKDLLPNNSFNVQKISALLYTRS